MNKKKEKKDKEKEVLKTKAKANENIALLQCNLLLKMNLIIATKNFKEINEK